MKTFGLTDGKRYWDSSRDPAYQAHRKHRQRVKEKERQYREYVALLKWKEQQRKTYDYTPQNPPTGTPS